MTNFIFGLALATYFFLHSLLAADGVKRAISPKYIPLRFYRLTYNILAISLLLPLALLFFSLEKTYLMSNFLAITGLTFMAGGVIWMGKSLAGYDLGEFSGFFQLKNEHPPPHTTLKINGLNRFVRHPLYFGILLLVWGWFLFSPTDIVLVTAILTTGYLCVGSRLEERKLTQQFGEAYRLYRKNTPWLIPFKWR